MNQKRHKATDTTSIAGTSGPETAGLDGHRERVLRAVAGYHRSRPGRRAGCTGHKAGVVVAIRDFNKGRKVASRGGASPQAFDYQFSTNAGIAKFSAGSQL
jgi:hypothetical protein